MSYSYSGCLKAFSKMLLTTVVLLLGGMTVFAQDREIKGTVKDDTGLPVIGAAVLVEGTSIAAMTDVDGLYSLSVPQDATTLRFTIFGMNDVLEPINNRSVIDVTMTYASTELDEVVVTALGIKKEQKSLSYNVQQVKTDETANPTGSFVNSLSGKVAGVTINQSSSGIGGGSRVVMRGTKSLTGNNNALYVIDGVPMPSLSGSQPSGVYEGAGQSGDGVASINQDDIESISVLSGPSAAALYGSAAANGVIIINTKKGGKDRLSVNYTNTTNFTTAYIMPAFQNTYGTTEEGSYQSWGAKMKTPSSYNPKDFFQTGFNETNSLSLSSGNDKNQTYVSLSSTIAEGIIHGNDYNRLNATVRNTTSFLDDRMSLDVSFMYSDITEENMISQGQYMNPVVPVYLFPAGEDFSRLEIYERYDPSRNMKVQYWPYESDLTMQNPYWVTERNKFVNNKNRFMLSGQLNGEVTDWLKLSARVKLDKSFETYEKKFNASTITLFASDYGYYNKREAQTTQTYADFLAYVNKYFADNTVNLTATVGTSIEDVQYGDNSFGGKLSSVANLFTFSNVTRATAEYFQSGYRKQKQSVFANVQVGWKSMVYLDVTARNDWTSTLSGSNVKSFFYPTVGLSGIMTDIIPGIKGKFLNYWKLRVSYSEVGNEPNPFLTIPTYSLSSGTPVTATRMPNTDLQPERTKSYELGTNLYFFNNSLKLDATAYYSQTYNQFFEPKLSVGTHGYSSVIINSGRVDNWGLELSARYSKEWGDFEWTSYANWSFNRNKIVDLVTDWTLPTTGEKITLNELEVGGTGGVKYLLKKGGSMTDIYVTSLVTDEHGAIYVHPSDQTVVADYNKFVYAGDTAPKHNLSWGNEFSWKGFTLDFMFTARIGGVVASHTQAIMDYYGISQATADARDNGGALVNGRRIPAQTYYQTIGAGTGVMSMYVYDATNIRLSNLTLTYNFPVEKWGKVLKGLSLSLVGNNLLMIYKKAPFDPELTSSTGTYGQGLDYFMQPSTRNLGFSVKVKF